MLGEEIFRGIKVHLGRQNDKVTIPVLTDEERRKRAGQMKQFISTDNQIQPNTILGEKTTGEMIASRTTRMYQTQVDHKIQNASFPDTVQEGPGLSDSWKAKPQVPSSNGVYIDNPTLKSQVKL